MALPLHGDDASTASRDTSLQVKDGSVATGENQEKSKQELAEKLLNKSATVQVWILPPLVWRGGMLEPRVLL